MASSLSSNESEPFENESTLKLRHSTPATSCSDPKEQTDSDSAFLKNGKSDDSKPKSKGPTTKKQKSFINVAPLNTPLKRRLQTFALIWHTISIGFFCCLFLFVVSLGAVSWVCILIPYFVWFYAYDLHTPTNGKVVYRVKDWIRNFILWEWFVDYFPIRVYKTCELEPTFTYEPISSDSLSDDEQDLAPDSTRSVFGELLCTVGLRKRSVSGDVPKHGEGAGNGSHLVSTKTKFKKVSTGPRYIFGYHPHGVISMGVMGLFATNSLRNEPFKPRFKFLKPFFHDPSKGERPFPGLGYVFPLTLTEQFIIPFYRDYLLGLGLTSASAKNIKSVINNGDNSVCLVVGGAQESLLNDLVGKDLRVGIGYKKPETDVQSESETSPESSKDDLQNPKQKEIRLVLEKRKGFVKLAIELGNVSLVPTFGFGEADIYKLTKPAPGSWGFSFQQWLKKTFHFTLPFFSARGVLIYDFGFLPYRTPINIVVGRPIYVPTGLLSGEADVTEFREQRSSSFTKLLNMNKKKVTTKRKKIPQELLDHYHGLYIAELKKLFEENKEKYGYGNVTLKIIE